MTNPYLVPLVVLAVVAAVVILMELSSARRTAGRRSRAARAGASSGMEPELLAVIAGAAREALQAPVRVHRVHVHRGPVIERWSRAGRMDIMISHRVEPKR